MVNKSFSRKRRDFLRDSSLMAAMMALAPQLLSAGTSQVDIPMKNKDGYRFLFQGDSITDGNRTRNNDWNHIMGHGYQYIIASELWYEFPGKGLEFFNRGVSGNTLLDLAARWQKDTLDLKPDLLSILIGINDITASINGDGNFTVDQYKERYGALLEQTKQQLPHVQLVLCEPFILPVGEIKDHWMEYSAEVHKRQEIVSNLVVEYDAIFIGFQKAFNEALEKAPAEYWIWDGIHPMPAGHELMAREWDHEVRKRLDILKKNDQ